MPSGWGARRPRLVASDLDGTLLRSDGAVSPRTAAVWPALPRVGVETVLVTARPPRWMHDLAQVVGEHGIAVCGNGAFVYDVPRRRVVAAHGLPDEVLDTLVRELRGGIPGIWFAAERVSGPLIEPGFPTPAEHPVPEGAVIAAVEERGPEPVGKLLALAPGIPDEDFLDTVTAIVGERAHVAFSGVGGLAEINARGVTKAVGLARWAAARGIDAAQVWAFGDMPNDLPMLRWAGRAIAVANAHPEVLAIVDEVCPSNDEDGVAIVVERLLESAC